MRLSLLLLVSTTACISVAEPGRFEPIAPTEGAKPASGLVARATPWQYSGDYEATAISQRFDESMRAHLQAAQLFSELRDTDPDVELRGEVLWMCEPISVLDSPVRCGAHETFGYAGSAMVALFTLGVWPAISIFGVPTDGGTAEASLRLRAFDPETGVELASWVSGEVAETAYAGLYYRGSPMAKALRSAADVLSDQVRASISPLEERVHGNAKWRDKYDTSSLAGLVRALSDPEPTIRSRALMAIAALETDARAVAAELRRATADPDSRVRWHAINALEASSDLDPATLATIEMLTKDSSEQVQNRAYLAKARLSFEVRAARIDDRGLANEVAQLGASIEQRVAALKAITSRSRAALPALPAVLSALAYSNDDGIARAAVEAIFAIGHFDADVDRALADLANRTDELGRAAALARAQLRVQPEPTIDEPTAIAPVAAPVPQPGRAIVAVFPIGGGKLSAAQRHELTDLYSAHLTALSGFKIVPSARIAAQIREQKAESYRECYDDACQIEVGKAIAAEKILTTKIIQQKGSCVISATLYDLRSEATESAAVVPGPCAASSLATTLRSVAQELAKPARD